VYRKNPPRKVERVCQTHILGASKYDFGHEQVPSIASSDSDTV
jgi:hypothetical protein